MKKVLPVAVLAALAGVNGAQAVHVNPDGLGQVLVYPFYTTENGQDTYINLVNTTDEFKAVKIRILESMNSREVLDFNIYMSPWDHWSATIAAHEDGGAAITSVDKTCTVPNAISNGATVPFRSTLYDGSGDADADSVDGIERTKEGYVEVIEMGVVLETDNGITQALEHIDGIPGGDPDSCRLLDDFWAIPQGDWRQDPTDGLTAPAGGLYGYGVLIDVPKGTDVTYDAVAIDNWDEGQPIHTGPGNLLPNIASGDEFYDIFDRGGVISGEAFDGTDAVSAILMQGTISNDYVLEPSVDAGTDWIVTFPTKRFYVNGPSAPISPFTEEWDEETSTACEVFQIQYWDREEGEPVDPPTLNDFSPLPPPDKIPELSFCHEANVLSFNASQVLSASGRTGVNLNLEGYDPDTGEYEEGAFINGWARITFAVQSGNVLPTFDHDFFGLPAVGFAVQRYVNGELEGGLLANYAGSVLHKGDRFWSFAD